MIPNAWFYMLKHMKKPFKNTTSSRNPNKKKSSPPSTTTTKTQPHHFSNPRNSYYFTTNPFKAEKLYNSPKNTKFSDTHFPEPPAKSSKTSKNPSTKTKKTLPPKLGTSTIWPNNHLDSTSEHSDHHSLFHSSPHSDFYQFLLRDACRMSGTDPSDSLTSWPSSCSCRISSSTADIIIDMDGKKSFSRKFNSFDLIPQLELPPILTKPAKFNDMVSEIKKFKSSTKFKSSPGVKIQSNSPKNSSKKIQAHGRKSKTSMKNKKIKDSYAIVKSSFDPQRDFRESMVEMILENNIRASKDLEELLACYLTLNSNEYHDIIVKVFKQIWYDLTNFRL